MWGERTARLGVALALLLSSLLVPVSATSGGVRVATDVLSVNYSISGLSGSCIGDEVGLRLTEAGYVSYRDEEYGNRVPGRLEVVARWRLVEAWGGYDSGWRETEVVFDGQNVSVERYGSLTLEEPGGMVLEYRLEQSFTSESGRVLEMESRGERPVPVGGSFCRLRRGVTEGDLGSALGALAALPPEVGREFLQLLRALSEVVSRSLLRSP